MDPGRKRKGRAMQAIVTKYLGPTNCRGGRVVAWCEAGRIVVGWNHAIGIPENHEGAARALVKKLGWDDRRYYRRWVLGALPQNTGGYVLVCAPRG